MSKSFEDSSMSRDEANDTAFLMDDELPTVRDLQHQIETMKAQHEKKQEWMTKKLRENTELANAIKNLQAEKDELRSQMSSFEKDNAALATLNAELKQEKEKILVKLNSRGDITSLEEDNDIMADEVTQPNQVPLEPTQLIDTDFDPTNPNNVPLEETRFISEETAYNIPLEPSMVVNPADRSVDDLQIQALKNEISRLEAELKDKNLEHEAEVVNFKSKIEEIQAGHQEKLETLETELREIQEAGCQKVSEQEKNFEILNEDFQNLMAEKLKLGEYQVQAEAKLTQLTEELERATETLQKMDQNLDDEKTAHDQVLKNNDQMTENLRDRDEKIETLTSEMQALQAKLEAEFTEKLAAAVSESQSDLLNLQASKISEIENAHNQELMTLRASHQEKINQWTEKLELVEVELNKNLEEKTKVLQEKADMTVCLDRVEQEQENLKQEREILLAKNAEMVQKLEQELVELRICF